MTQLNPALQARVQPIKQKWDGFVAKVGQRVQEILAEAQAGLDQIIAQYPTDPGPMGTAMTAVQSRFQGLDQKVSESWDKVSEEMDGVQDDDLEIADYMAVSAVADAMRQQCDELREHIDLQYAWLEMRKQADWGRRLYELMQQEVQQPLTCSQCGAPFQNPVYWMASNVPCPHCGSLVAVQPGAASVLFYQGLGIHAMSHEQAWSEWMALQAADRAFKEFRHPTSGDYQRYLDAAGAYWARYYETTRQMNPGFNQPVEEAVANRLAQYTAYEQPLDRIQRDFFQALCQAAAQRNQGQLQWLLQQLPAGVDIGECAESLVEHGDEGGAVMVLEYQHRVEGEDEPLKSWVPERLKEIKGTLRR
ncbi:MAG: hypothetical protein RBU30_18840 [Polyangia bacterium]|jgi:hypothetical protein|nr:hypothetical protein [Polyangia bacterium]